MRRDLGDFQTPAGLVADVLDRLAAIGVSWSRVLEPTCGVGRFIEGLVGRLDAPAEVRGFEIQRAHLEIARTLARPATTIDLVEGDFFASDLASLTWRTSGPLLVVGNPPWVTSAALGRLGSENRPSATRIAGLSGLDARTGRANFDLAEAAWIKLLSDLDEPDATIALLCKESTARNVFRWADRAGRPIASASIIKIDARLWFDARVDACLFVVRPGGTTTCRRAEVFADLRSSVPESSVGLADGLLISDLDALEAIGPAFGRSSRTWRQGVKHDLASVMELTGDGRGWRNGLGDRVEVEAEFIYPLRKAVDLASPSPGPSRGLILTQRRLGESTERLDDEAPRLAAYLRSHAGHFAARRSRVYEGRSPYAIFGVGDYTFARHKVAVSGLHKVPRFSALGPEGGRPVLLDDACYHLPCETLDEARRIAGLLNGPVAGSLLRALTFRDAKRPITKAILQRIDLDRLDPEPILASALGVE